METTIGYQRDEALGSKVGVDGEVIELSKKENLDLSSDGLKDTDADEVFEETLEPEAPVINAEKSKKIAGQNMESVGSLENGDPDAAQQSEHNHAQAEIPINEVETQNDVDVVVRDGTDKLHDETNVGERVDVAPTDGQCNYPSYFDMVIKESKHEGGVSENVSSLGTSDFNESKDLDADTGEGSTVEMFETPRFNVVNGSENPQKPDIEGNDGVVEVQDANKVKEGHVGSMEQENGILHHVTKTGILNNEDTKSGNDNVNIEELEITSEIKDAIDGRQIEGDSEPVSQSNGTSCQIDDQYGTVSKDGVLSESKSNGDVIHTAERSVAANESVAVLGHGYEQENSDILATQNLDIKDLVGEEEEMPHISVPNAEGVDKTKDQELEIVDGHTVDNDETTGVTASDISSPGDANESNEAETNLPPLVESSTHDLEIAKAETPNLGPSKLLTESPTSPQTELRDTSDTVSKTYTDIPGKEGGKDDTKEEAVSESKEQECEIISSPGESTISKTYPERPELTADIQKPVSGDTPINGEKEAKAKVAISSSAETVTTRPAGLGHTAPLLQPTQNAAGNKESGSRASSNVPPTKSTSAAPARPAGLGRDAPLLEPATRVSQHPRVNGGTSPPRNQLVEDQNGDAEEYDETREKLQMIRVKFLRLAHRLGQTPHNVVVAQVLYRLGLAEQLRGRSGGRVGAFSFDRASAMAEQLEAAGQEALDFTCTIMVLGKSGVGKSATINSIFDENMFGTDAFQVGTKKVQDIVGTVQGIRVRVIDTPGLLPSWSDQRQNEKILHSVKRFIKKTPPDIVLYLDRLDMQGRDFGETPLLRTITDIFGPSIWFNAIVVLTHAASAPPEGPNGTATSYDMFVTQRSHIVQQAIRQAAGDMRLMNPVSLVENHSACRTNRAGQRVLPNGQVWKPHLLLLSFASKILAEANTLLKLQDSPPGRPFAPRTRSPPLPFLLSSLLQSRPEVKLPSEQFGDDDDDAIDDDLDESSDSEDDGGYDELPPFRSLPKAELEKLTSPEKKAYYDELEYREKLFIKKQLKEEKKRRKMMKKMQEALKDMPPEFNESAEEESAGAASVPIPMPDLSLPASFDSDYPTHRYRSLDTNPWIVRAVLEPNGWDHDIGYEGINAERLFVVKDKVPISFSGHISKDKKDANLQMEVASSIKHGKGKSTSMGFEMQSVGKDMVYTMRSETRFSNHKINKAAAGFSATLLGDVLTGGIKLEDKLLIGKRGQVVLSGGGIYGRGDVAYGGSLEATLKDKDQPLGRFLSTLGVSVMDWHGDLAIGCNSQTQIPVGRFSNLIARFNISNRGSGQVSLRVNSSEHLQIVLIGMIPLVKKLLGNDKNG